METPVFYQFDDIEVKEIAPGFFSKLIHTDSNTINFIEVKAGCAVALHRHVHQQLSFVLEGVFEMTVEGEARKLDQGQYCIIPCNAEHGGTALTDCRLIDVFSPARDDYRLL